MAEQVKSIIEVLSKPPFNKNFNIISFDNLEPLQLLQVLNDVFAYIDSRVRILSCVCSAVAFNFCG